MRPIGPLSSPREALDALCLGLAALELEAVPLELAGGRILGTRLVADRPSPAVSVSSMDGYALRLADLLAAARTTSGDSPSLPLAGEVRIGAQPAPLPPGAAMRIVTGGAVPEGADTIVKREETKEVQVGSPTVSFLRGRIDDYKPGQFVRHAGENIRAGEDVLEAGVLIAPPVAAALASFGAAHVTVRRRVRVSVLITGDEVLPAGAAPSPWQLRDSNAATLRTALTTPSWIELVECTHVADEPEAMTRMITRLLAGCDALVLTGGVSMGERDFVPAAIARAGGTVLFHKVRQRPGNPVLGARSASNQPIFALPGNAVSVMATARRLVMPTLACIGGRTMPSLVPQVELSNADTTTIELWWHRPVRLTSDGRAELIDSRGSGDLVAAARADGFVELPPRSSGAGPWPYYAWGYV